MPVRETKKISSATVRADFNELSAIIYYARAAHELGLWESERTLIQQCFPDRSARLLEAGCGAGRVTLGLWELGFGHLTGFDFADELVDQARSLAAERKAYAIRFVVADATDLGSAPDPLNMPFDGALFMFNGLMQIPGRGNRRAALRELHRACRPGAPLIFTTHDRNSPPGERAMWREEAARWSRGEQDPRLIEFGDRYFVNEAGRTFMHLPDRDEILEDLAATRWSHELDAMRSVLARESQDVRNFSDECRFWVARRALGAGLPLKG